MAGENISFAKTICSICYEDLKPIIEDLQSISICGHVFHELCLQQWFEYCPKGKKRNCPVCKQNCTNSNVGRLYFQSVGDQNEASLSQKPSDYKEAPEELRKEVNRLEGKANALSSTLELQQKELEQVKDQLLTREKQLTVEVNLKNEAQTQKAMIQQLLCLKSAELDKSTLECMRLGERNMALAKELATLKLASDLNLDEDEVMKLASLGNDAGSKETVEVLRKSLVNRNKSYKELMAKCNILGRGEARSLHKLEKANEKIKKLKLRVQELETVAETKENEALRVLKDQNNKSKTYSHGKTMKGTTDQGNLDKAANMPDDSFSSRKVEPLKPLSRKRTKDTCDQNDQGNVTSLVDEDDDLLLYSSKMHGFLDENRMPCTVNFAKSCQVQRQDATFNAQNEADILRPCSKNGVRFSPGVSKSHESNKPPVDIDDDVICYGDANPIESSFHVRKETGSSVPSVQPGGHCFSGGLLGPDGTNWHLGKWCKKVQTPGSMSNARANDLITVGADGRGGTIKVMRSLDRSLDIKDTSSWTKKSKHVGKTEGLQPKGHLQIEHFFQRKP